MAGILYLVATPIGNLGDFTPRAVETLENADFIAAEDTRVSVKLLNHFGIKKPLVSYHEHNHITAGQAVLNRLLAGESCALVTDAGTPAISDPGEDLVRLCAEAGVTVSAIPGPCALVTALEGQAEKLQSLIEALVKTSRLETGILELHPRPGLLGPMLEDAAAQFAPKTAAKELTLRVIAPEMRAVFDAKWTEEAVCNLLDNAVKYTPAGGSITLEAIAYELFCRIDVTDTGPGIPEAEQARVFQRFYRSAAAYEAEGVGIGLYLSRQIVQGQGGYLKVFSRPGYGAKFSMYLPRETNL